MYVNIIKGLRGNREDTEALRFQVKQKLGAKKEKIWASMFLLSVDAKEGMFLSKNVAQLPLCLLSGDSVLCRQLLSGIGDRFDCVTYPVEMPEDELMWMSALWSSLPPPSANTGENKAPHKDHSKK